MDSKLDGSDIVLNIVKFAGENSLRSLHRWVGTRYESFDLNLDF
jgi:hypothetical protein